jgi:DNA polymerase III delta subunit
MKKRFWWLDSTDHALARQKLDSVRAKQLSEWEWIKWDEDDYADAKEAHDSLVREIGMPPMFAPGKVVYVWGLPSFHSKLAEEIPSIPDRILFIVIARPVKSYRLYARAKELAESKPDAVLLDEAFTLTKEKVGEFTIARAETLGLKITEAHARMLADLVGTNPNSITKELEKLKFFCEDGIVTQFAIEQTYYGEGESNSLLISKALLGKKEEMAHELIARALAQEAPMKLLGLLTSWSRTLLAATSGEYNYVKETAATIQSIKKTGGVWKTAPMWPNPGRIYHTYKEFQESGFCKEWPLLLSKELMRLQMSVFLLSRKPDMIQKEFHGFVTRVIEQANEVRYMPTRWVDTRPYREGPAGSSRRRDIMTEGE